jgi:hypothetical protein
LSGIEALLFQVWKISLENEPSQLLAQKQAACHLHQKRH